MKSKCPYKKKRRRVGRGIGSTTGKTAGRGVKGQFSRTGAKARLYSEGGQNSFIRRLPKRGFNHPTKKEYAIINIATIATLDKAELTAQDFINAGVIKKVGDGVKILAKGELSKAVTVHAHKFSQAAIDKITQAGGKIVEIKAS